MKATWSIVVMYESTETRESAMTFCDCLLQQFWVESGLDVGWWSFDTLAHANSARKAAERARTADWIIFATDSPGDMPEHVCAWVEGWLDRRGDREGTLVGLIPENRSPDKHVYLRSVAHRGCMDYLTQLPESISQPITDARDSFTERARTVTSVLDDILQHAGTPPRLPL
jgi:hypothetical protein